MLLVLVDRAEPQALLAQLKGYGLQAYAVQRVQEFVPAAMGPEVRLVLYCGIALLAHKKAQKARVLAQVRQVPVLWFPERILLSKQEWIQSYELGLSFVPGTLANLEVLLAKLRQLLDTGNNRPDVQQQHSAFLTLVHAYLEAHHLDSDFTIEKMGLDLGMSRTKFYSKVKAAAGLSPSRLVMRFRLQKAEALLLAQQANVTEVAYQTGFSSAAYFTKCFKEFFGKRPSELTLSSP